MNKIKLILTVTLTFVVLFAQAGHAAAAPLTQTPTADITGDVTSISFETDANNETVVVVTLVDDQNVTQTVRINVDTAVSLGLLTLDENNLPVIDSATGFPTPVDVTQLIEPITITADTIIPDEEPVEEPVHPISALLAGFFGEEASVIDGYHEDGFGFGVIAQALWMSQNLTGTEDETGDASLAEEILQAKQDKSFEDFFESHPEIIFDGSVPTNWGQFRKVLLNKKQNLGVVVSGQADESNTSVQQEHGNGNGNNNGHGNGNGNNGNGHGNGNGQGNGNGNGNNNRP